MIKVASYNIRKGIGADRRRNPDRILDVLREVDADIIALQEADRRFGEREGVLPLCLLDDHSDWKPIVYLFTDGKPTDVADAAIDRWQRTYARKAHLIAVGLGRYADLAVLLRLTETVLLFEDSPRTISPSSSNG